MTATVLQMRVALSDESSTCCNCGVEFASPVLSKRRDDGRSFWCPNGHQQHYTKTTEQKLRDELEEEKRKRMSAESSAEWAKSGERSARIAEGKAKAALGRVQARVNAGVCPHCNRTFQQLARHMHSKHPECAHGS